MRFQINLGLSAQPVPMKVENGRNMVMKIGASAYFAAPNPLPHPTLASITPLINTLETAYENALGGSKIATLALKSAEIAYDNAITELSHYVEDRANADPNNGETIIVSAAMIMKAKTPKTIPTFSVKNNVLTGSIDVKVKATKGALYIFQTSPDPVPPATALVWTQASVGSKCKVTISGLTPAKKMWVRFALLIKGVQQDWSDGVSIVIT